MCSIKLHCPIKFHSKMISAVYYVWSLNALTRCYKTAVFTALHAMQTRSSDENSVHPSVCLSVHLSFCQTSALWRNGRKICPDFFIPYERSFSLVIWEEKWLVGGRPLLPEILGQPAHVGAKSPIFNRYSLVAVTPSGKISINTNSKSTRRFKMSLI